MTPDHRFEHLALVRRGQGPARLPRPPLSDNLTIKSREDRENHSQTLADGAEAIANAWTARRAERTEHGAPEIKAGIPLMLMVDTALDLDSLRHFFEFEVVSEHEDGFVIVASEDISLRLFREKIQEFAGGIRGSATIARIHQLDAEPDQTERLSRILSERLLSEWPTMVDAELYVVDLSIACTGTWQIPKKPTRGKRATDEDWAKTEAEWATQRVESYVRWDELRIERVSAVEDFIHFYGGEILGDFDGFDNEASILPDSFTLRVRVVGAGIKDFVINYPYLFEVTEPDDFSTPQQIRRQERAQADAVTLLPPSGESPAVCVIDSGIQEEHKWLRPAVDVGASLCFIPGRPRDAVADEVRTGGHGTRVAGAVLYGEVIPVHGEFTCEAWIQNARILDENNQIPATVLPPSLLRDVVEHYHRGDRRTRIFNHSINACTPCRLRHMSAWAAEIDLLCNNFDILFIQSSGNLVDSNPLPFYGLTELINSGQGFPEFLSQSCCRVANPGQSLQALTVGSVAHSVYEDDDWRTFASEIGESSGFSRTGLGIWDSIKPEVVELGGDCLHTKVKPYTIGSPTIARECYPELLRSTLFGGPAFDRDEVGTSFAAPKVSRIAARLQTVLPNESALLYRALIVQSARWPESAQNLSSEQKLALLKRIGYGVPSLLRATTNDDYRVTYVTSGAQSIGSGDCHVYQVPIPTEIGGPGDDFRIRIEVTLSYCALPRRTRRTLRGYLSTWVDWRSNRLGESVDAFLSRALRTESETVREGDGTGIKWTLGARADWGDVQGIRRDAGTVQKDWADVNSNALPEDLCIAVRGHQGWSRDPDSKAAYTLAVSLEILGKEIQIYEPLRTAVLELQNEIEAETELPLEIEVTE